MTEREFEAPGVEEAVLAIAAQLNRREMAYFRIIPECPADVFTPESAHHGARRPSLLVPKAGSCTAAINVGLNRGITNFRQ